MRIEPTPAQIQRTHHRCAACRTRFGVDMLVNVPIDQFVAQMKGIRCPACGGRKITMGEGRTVSEDLETRIEGSEQDRLRNWKEQGERGLSSDAIAAHMTGASPAVFDAPRDLDDVRRCVLLLGHLPEWRPRMAEMARHPQWAAIAPRWDLIERTYLEESPNLDSKAPRAAALLEEAR